MPVGIKCARTALPENQASPPNTLAAAQDQIDQDLALHGPLALVKPDGFRLEELLGVVEALLGALPPSRPSPRAPPQPGHPPQRKRLKAPTS